MTTNRNPQISLIGIREQPLHIGVLKNIKKLSGEYLGPVKVIPLEMKHSISWTNGR